MERKKIVVEYDLLIDNDEILQYAITFGERKGIATVDKKTLELDYQGDELFWFAPESIKQLPRFIKLGKKPPQRFVDGRG